MMRAATRQAWPDVKLNTTRYRQGQVKAIEAGLWPPGPLLNSRGGNMDPITLVVVAFLVCYAVLRAISRAGD